jgi:Helix-turn-helix domain
MTAIQSAALAADLAGVRARMAAARQMTEEQRDQLWQDLEQRHLAAARARAARLLGQRTPKPRRRAQATAPAASRQFATVSTTASRDERLSMGARNLLTIIVAECGRTGERLLSNSYLGQRVGRSARQVQRYVAELVALGYVETWPQWNSRGAQTGRWIRPAAKCWPDWHRRRGGSGAKASQQRPQPAAKPRKTWGDRSAPHKLAKSRERRRLHPKQEHGRQ